MASGRSFHIVDVFAEAPLAGNPLAVVLDADGLDRAARQALAREFNFSETTFVVGAPDAAGTRVHIHTPAEELPFAGHPTLGTAWVLAQLLAAGETAPGRLVLELGVGPVPVELAADSLLWLDAPTVHLGAPLAAPVAAQLLGLSPSVLHPSLPVRDAAVGPQFLLVPLADPQALQGLTLSPAAAQRGTGVFFFALDPDAPATVHARMLFDAAGIREDPATGSANACLAAFLRAHLPGLHRVTVHQGVAMGRPSLLHLDISAERLRVGGRVQPVATGTLVA